MKQLIRFIIIASILLIVLGSRPLAFQSTSQVTGLGFTGDMVTITPDVTVSQTFIATEKNITGLFIVTGVLEKKLRGTLHLKLMETIRSKNGQILEGETLVNVSRDIEYQSDFIQFYFWFSPVKVRKGALMKATITASLDEGTRVTIWKSKNDIYKNGSLYVNSTEKRGDLAFAVYSNKQPIEISSAINNKALLPASLILILLIGSTSLAAIVIYQFSKVFRE